MDRRLTARISVFLIVLSIAGIASADQAIQKPEFSMTIPDGWIEIPRDVLDEYAATVKSLAPNAGIERYDYGFQANSGEWFTYPYILVENRRTGRLPQATLEQAEKIDMSAVARNEQRNLGSIATGFRIDAPVFDQETKLLWLRAEANVATVGPVSGLLACAPTEQGLIRASAFALAPDFPAYEPVFRANLGNLRADPSIAYVWGAKSARGTQTKAGAAASLLVTALLTGLLIGLIVYLVRNWMTD